MTQAAATPNKTKQKKDSRDIRAEAQKIANSIKTDGQSPAETKAIANGIQRGMEMFLRQQSEKARDLDKRTKHFMCLTASSTADSGFLNWASYNMTRVLRNDLDFLSHEA